MPNRSSPQCPPAVFITFWVSIASVSSDCCACIFALSGHVAHVSKSRRTPHARIQARFSFPEEYPTYPLLAELSSPSLPQPFLRKLTKKVEDAARARLGGPQVMAALDVLVDAVNNNKFLPCWKELRQAAQRASEPVHPQLLLLLWLRSSLLLLCSSTQVHVRNMISFST